MSPSKSARYHARRRLAVLDALGGACAECHTRDASCEVDHVLSDGHAERSAYGHARFISHILRDTRPPEFGPLQLLCPPCHAEKTSAYAAR